MWLKEHRGADNPVQGVDIFEEKQPENVNYEPLKQDNFLEVI